MVLFGANLVNSISIKALKKAQYSIPNLHFFGAILKCKFNTLLVGESFVDQKENKQLDYKMT